MYEEALRLSLLFRSIALRMMAPMTIGPVQKRLKPNVKKAIKIDIMSRGKYMKRLQTSKMIPVTTSPAISQPIPKIPRKIERRSSTMSGVLLLVLNTVKLNGACWYIGGVLWDCP